MEGFSSHVHVTGKPSRSAGGPFDLPLIDITDYVYSFEHVESTIGICKHDQTYINRRIMTEQSLQC